MVTVAPVLQHGDLRTAVVGLSNMLNPGGAVLSCSLHSANEQTSSGQAKSASENGSSHNCQLDLTVKGHGLLLLYSSAPPSSVVADACKLPFDYHDQSGRLTVSLSGERLQQHCVIMW